VFYHGFTLDDLPEFELALYEHVERLSPADYFVMHRNIRDNFSHAPIESLAGHLAFAHWDPHIYRKITKQICAQISNAHKTVVSYLVSHIPDIAANFYYMPQAYDVHFDLGLLLHTLRRYKEAIPYYESSRHYYGDRFDIAYNLAICEYNGGKTKQARAHFEQALAFRPDSIEAKQFIDFIDNTEGDKSP
jgi:tetratricopeptide (TPR) repeat protein